MLVNAARRRLTTFLVVLTSERHTQFDGGGARTDQGYLANKSLQEASITLCVIVPQLLVDCLFCISPGPCFSSPQPSRRPLSILPFKC